MPNADITKRAHPGGGSGGFDGEDRLTARTVDADGAAPKHLAAALEAARRELENFSYAVSHDLRAPLRQIDGFARILGEHLGSSLDEQGMHYLSRIQEGTRHLGRLIEELLAMTRLGMQEMIVAPVKLEVVVGEVVERIKADARDREIQWKVGPLPIVDCDVGLMRVVLTHLLSNASKYTRGRAPAVIEVGQIEASQIEVPDAPVLFVRDNGVGFDMKYADRLFGVFQRLHRVEDFEGIGVGLANAQRIVHRHGGRIWAEAEPGQGATFYFTLKSPVVTIEDGA